MSTKSEKIEESSVDVETVDTARGSKDGVAPVISAVAEEPTTGEPEGVGMKPLNGWRLGIVLFVLCLGLFFTIVETTITATALVTIGNHFSASIKSTWIVISYLLTYMGFALISARLSDTIGIPAVYISGWVLFSMFSLAGGLAKSMNALIIFRAFQGMGGSVLYSIAMVLFPQVCPMNRWGLVSGLIGITFAVASVFGPLLGGIITSHTTWRWIYLLNSPVALISVPLFLLAWPRNHDRRAGAKLSQVDLPGVLLLLAASVFLVFAIQEAGSNQFAWRSPIIIASLVISGVSWAVFIGWIVWLENGQTKLLIDPIFPVSVAMTRPTGPAIIMSFCTGAPFFVTVINLPIRFQLVNGDSPIMAGVHLLPMLAAAAAGSAAGGAISSKKNLTSHMLIVSACLMALGCGLLSTSATSKAIPSSLYGYQVLLGFGIGMTFSSYSLLIAFSNTYKNAASAQGAVVQVRLLGGVLGLAISTILLNDKIGKSLSVILSPSQILALQQSFSTVSTLAPAQQERVALVFGESFKSQMIMCTGWSCSAICCGLFTWQRRPVSIQESRERQGRAGIVGEKV